MNFYFCETCGKRVTDTDIEHGVARDKKLKGVYCKECAVGIHTMEMTAISEEQLREPVPATPQSSKSMARNAPPVVMASKAKPVAAKGTRSQLGVVAAALAGCTIIAVGVILLRTPNATKTAERPAVPAAPIAAQSKDSHSGSRLAENPPPAATQPPQPQIPASPGLGLLEPEKEPPAIISDNFTTSTALKADPPAHDESPPAPAKKNLEAEAPAAQPAIDPNAAKAAYAQFQIKLLAALRDNQAASAGNLLSAAEQDVNLKPMNEELRQDRTLLAWLQDIDKAALAGAEKLRTADDFELCFPRRSPLHVGTRTEFKLASIKDAKLEVQGQIGAMTIAIDTLDRGTIARLARLSYASDGPGLLRASFAALQAASDAKAVSEARALLERAQKEQAAPEELACVQRLLQTCEHEAREFAATKAWNEAQQLCEKKQWKPLALALAAFQRQHAATEFAAAKQEELKALQAAADEGITMSEGYGFNFETPDSFARFKRVFAAVKPNGMEMKYESGKIVFHTSSDAKDGGGFYLQAESVKLGANWEANFRVNLKIGTKEIAESLTSLGAQIDFRFQNPGSSTSILNPEAFERFSLCLQGTYEGYLSYRLLGPGQRLNGTNDPTAFAGMKSVGNSGGGYLAKGKTTKPASADGVYDVTLSMRKDHMKIVINGMDAVDGTLPDAAMRVIQSSPLTLFVFAGKGQDVELLRFMFKNGSDYSSPSGK